MDLRQEAEELLRLADAATRGPWEKRDHPRGELVGTIVQAPRAEGMAYNLEVLGDDYTGYGDNEQRARDVAFVASAHRMADLIRRLLGQLP